MNLSFIPGQLQLQRLDSGEYMITIEGEEVFRSQQEKKALAGTTPSGSKWKRGFQRMSPRPKKNVKLLNV